LSKVLVHSALAVFHDRAISRAETAARGYADEKERSCAREHNRDGGFMARAARVAATIRVLTAINHAGLHNSEIAAKIIPRAKK
jgi:hypothetical protein